MTSFIIAGSSDCPQTTECEKLARCMKRLYSNLDFKLILKYPTEWGPCIQMLCKYYGFKEEYNPIIFTSDGKLIGGLNEFYELAHKRFNIKKEMIDEKFGHNVNVKIANDEYNERHRQKTLMEKIIQKYTEALNNNLIKRIGGVFQEKEEYGLIFFVKAIPEITPKIFIDKIIRPPKVIEEIIEDVEVNFKEKVIIKNNPKQPEKIKTIEAPPPSIEVKNETTIDGGEPSLEPNIVKGQVIITDCPEIVEENQKILNEEAQKEPNLEIQQESSENIQKVANLEIQNELRGETPKEINLAEVKKALNEEFHKEFNIEIQIENITLFDLKEDEYKGQYEEQVTEDFQKRIDIEFSNSPNEHIQKVITSYRGKVPLNANFISLNDYIIEDLEDNFYLALHPYPVLEGQCVLFQKFKKVREEESKTSSGETEIGLIDYSLFFRERIEMKGSKFENGYYVRHNIFQKNSEAITSLLNREKLDLFDPLTGADWKKIYKVIVEIDSYAIIQYLPRGKKSHLNMTCGIVNIFPRKFLLREYKNYGILNQKKNQSNEFEQLPFEYLINESLQRQQCYNNINNSKQNIYNNSFAKDDNLENIYTLDELPFIHAISVLDDKYDHQHFINQKYETIMKYLDFKYYHQQLRNYGVNIILGKNWLMVIPLTNPLYEYQDTLFYVLPCAFIGYFLKPVFQSNWPQSAGLDVIEESIIDMLIKSTKE